MNRRDFIGTLGVGLLAAPLAAEAQRAGKVARIGVLGDTSPPVEARYSGIAAFGQEAHEAVVTLAFHSKHLRALPRTRSYD